jgi:hypothetical protein
MRFAVVAAAALLVPVAGCLPDEEPEHCSAWTLGGEDEHGHQAFLHVRNERAETVCVHVRFSGTDVAKIPLQPAQGESFPADERSLPWEDAQATIRVGEWTGDRYTTQTVNLEQAPHIAITVLEDELQVQTHQQAPWDAQS